MGYAISWVAVRGKTPDEVCSQLGLVRTGQYDCVPDSPIVGAELPDGWYLVWGNDMGFTNRLPLGSLSKGAELVDFLVEEHVMASNANGWKNGHKIWSIEHDTGQGIMHVKADGDLPLQYAEIRDRLLKKQEAEGKKPEVDYVIDIPVEVAKVLTGFRYDEDIPGTTEEDELFETLHAATRSPLDGWKPGGCLGTVAILSLVSCIGLLVFVLK